MAFNYPKNQDYQDRLKAAECPDSTYKSSPPLVFHRAKGSYVYDIDGNTYLDFCMGFGSLGLGHNYPELVDSLQKFLDQKLQWQSMGDVYPHASKIHLIENILKHLPPKYKRVSLSLTGSDAIATAVKTSQISTKKHGFLAIKDCYHGVEFGALKLTHRSDFKEPFIKPKKDPDVIYINPHCSEAEITRSIQILKESEHGFAGVILEPVLGRGGLVPLDLKWVKTLTDLTHKHSGLVILDEILCGLGRCGKFSFTDEIDADLTCFGKNLGGGMPLSACVGTEAVMGAWPESKGEAIHTGTFFGHGMSCYTANQNMIIHDEQKLFSRALPYEKILRSRFEKALNPFKEHIKDIRSCGLWMNVEFIQDGFGVKLMDACREHGLIALVCGSSGQSISIIPPLNVKEEEIIDGAKRLALALSQLLGP